MRKGLKIGILIVILLAVLVAVMAFVIDSATEEQEAIGIIGGADGPTAMLVAGNIVKTVGIPLVIGGVVLVIGYMVVKKKQKK